MLIVMAFSQLMIVMMLILPPRSYLKTKTVMEFSQLTIVMTRIPPLLLQVKMEIVMER